MSRATLPAGVEVFERGWLSSNNILLHGASPGEGAVLIDSGYVKHAPQTVALVENALGPDGRLRLIANTHLHSDHCGGNAALVERYGCPIHVPPGEFLAVQRWDENLLSYRATGQQCPRFHAAGKLMPGEQFRQGGLVWEIHAAPGHDPHSVILFEQVSRTLISADALWERGFGIVFPELDGVTAFDDVEATLNLIDTLDPATVIPGHGSAFNDTAGALLIARQRLEHFRNDPARHANYGAKALMVFHMLEVRRCERAELLDWSMNTPILTSAWRRAETQLEISEWAAQVIDGLVSSGALRTESHNGREILAAAGP